MRLIRYGLAAALAFGDSTGSWARAMPDDATLALPLAPATAEAVAGINHFTLDLFKGSGPSDVNLFLSPASVSVAVSLAYRGARGTTADELRRVLYYSAPPETYLSAQAPLLQAMTFSRENRLLSTNNGLWLQTGLAMKADYLADVTRNAGAGLMRVDYTRDHEQARKTINQWVSSKTNDRINNLLAPDNVSESTRAILVNTIYWKANWASEFDAAVTKVEPFHLLSGKEVPAKLMRQEAYFRTLDRGGVKAIELPYTGNEVSLIALMPDRPSDLPKVEAKLTDPALKQLLADLSEAKPRRTILTLPKMHLAWGGDLVPTLTTMGIKAAFDQRADFSGTATLSGDQVLAIGAIIHQSWLDVDETGSEAAAATAVVEMVVTGARKRAPEPPPFVFRADKPFMFMLLDRRTGMILFVGRYVGPAAN